MRRQQPASGKQFTEPEIISPSAEARLRDRDAIWTSLNEHGTHRIYFTKLGPFRLLLLALGIGLVVAFAIVLAIGIFFALFVTASITSPLLRQWFRRWH
jgi:preprotein translocase subunit SecF